MWSWQTALLAALSALALARATPLPAHAAPRDDTYNYTLPDDVVPERYYVNIKPDYVEKGYGGVGFIKTYSGEVVIEALIKKATNQIVLHKGPTITEVSLICVVDLNDEASMDIKDGDNLKYIANFCSEQDGPNLKKEESDEEAETEKYIINLAELLTVGHRIRIVLVFEASFPDGGLTGFYVSTYEDENGNEVPMLTTKFEPTHARKAFPCFDEPALKATFDLAISLANETEAISNMDEDWRTVANETGEYYSETVVFKTSPRMSPYLLAFIVYEENSFGSLNENPRPTNVAAFRTWGRKHVITDEGRLSQIEGPAALEFLEKYTGIKYSETMQKMDMAAIPDFQSGAMENWGLVTYRESALLYEEDSTTAAYKRVLDVIAHELTHMWFGNLVTTEWWSSIWLNEGFARYLQYLVVDDRYPNWRMLERFVLDEQMGVFGVDADINARPITDDNVKSPTEIGNHFSTISYSKGGAILRQICNVMGEENFQKGVQEYLIDRYLNSSTPEDLFKNLVNNNNQDITNLTNTDFESVLKAWSETSGYPVITVFRNNSNTFTVTQERFLLVPDSADTTNYPVYLSWTTSGDEPLSGPISPGGWLLASDTSKEITIEGISSNDWVIFNANQGGYYRVNYDDAMWNQIERLLDDEDNLAKVSPIDRAALVDNALNLARAGIITYERAFRALRFLRHDVDFAPWAAARSGLAHVQRMVGHEQAYKDFVEFIIEKAYNATDFEVGRLDAHLEKVHRTNILTLACSVGYERCIEEAQSRLTKYLKPSSTADSNLHPDLQSVVFCYGLKNDNGDLWDLLWDQYVKSGAAKKALIITALGCIDHRDILKEYLRKSVDDFSSSPKLVRSQDAYTVFSAVYSSPEGVDVALDFLTFWGYDKLEQNYGEVRNALATLISGIASRLTTKEQLKQLENAVGDKHSGALDTVRSNIDWLETHSDIAEVLNVARTLIVATSDGAPAAALPSALALLCAALLLLH